jgi:hypothetical protein
MYLLDIAAWISQSDSRLANRFIRSRTVSNRTSLRHVTPSRNIDLSAREDHLALILSRRKKGEKREKDANRSNFHDRSNLIRFLQIIPVNYRHGERKE